MKQSNHMGGQPEAGSNKSTPNEFAQKMLGEAATGGNFTFIKGLFNAIALIFAWVTMPFIRIRFGVRAIQWWFLLLVSIVFSMLGTVDLFLNKVPAFSGTLQSYFFGLHWKLALIAYAYHGWQIHKEKRSGKIKRHTRSTGDSILFPLWAKLGQSQLVTTVQSWPVIKDLPGKQVWYDYDVFMQYGEPLLVMLCGYLVGTTSDSFYGNVIILSGISLAYIKYLETEKIRNAFYDALDAQRMAEMLGKEMQQQKDLDTDGPQEEGDVVIAGAPRKTPAKNGPYIAGAMKSKPSANGTAKNQSKS